MIKSSVKYLILLIILVGLSGIISADDLSNDKDQDTNLTFASKRGTKLSSKKLISNDNFQILNINSESNLKDMDEVYSGTQYIVRIKPIKKTHLYVFNLDSSNKLYSIFPRKDIRYKNPLKKRKVYNLPPSEDDAYEFDTTKGVELFYVYASTKPIRKLEKLASKIDNSTGLSVSDDLKNSLDDSSNFLKAPGGEKSNFFRKLVLVHKANKNAKPDKNIVERAKKEINSKNDNNDDED